jgi:2-oxoisovalerate dehydrogenase E2 component (dihydrolipoyl transacylase)
VNREFKLPDVGEGLTEADIVSWRVKPGDVISVNQVIVEIETAKSLVELPSPWAGTVAALLVEEGQTVDVGIPIIAIETEARSGQPAPPASSASPVPASPQPDGNPTGVPAVSRDPGQGGERGDGVPTLPGGRQGGRPPGETQSPGETQPPGDRPQPVLVGYGVRPGATTRRRRKDPTTRPGSYPATPSLRQPAPAESPPSAAPPEATGAAGAAKALAKPPVRRLARDLGVDLSVLAGTGPHGSVTHEDVRKAAGEPAVRSGQGSPGSAAVAAPATAAGLDGREERVPVKGVRKHTAAAMVASAFTAPHVTEFLQVDVTETMAAVRRVRDLPELAGVKVSPLLFVARALLTAVARHPMINSSWDEAAQEIVIKRYVNLGIAAATDRGLIVPTVKDAHALSLAGLARALEELASTARAGKATPGDLSGGTITITNVGVFGIDAGTPILTPGEAAILAFGVIRDAPWVVGGQLAVRKVTTLSLSFDHRIVDGELGSAVLRDVGSMLEDPIRMLAWS